MGALSSAAVGLRSNSVVQQSLVATGVFIGDGVQPVSLKVAECIWAWESVDSRTLFSALTTHLTSLKMDPFRKEVSLVIGMGNTEIYLVAVALSYKVWQGQVPVQGVARPGPCTRCGKARPLYKVWQGQGPVQGVARPGPCTRCGKARPLYKVWQGQAPGPSFCSAMGLTCRFVATIRLGLSLLRALMQIPIQVTAFGKGR